MDIQVGATAEAYLYYRLLSWGYDAHFASGLTSPFDLFIAYKGKIIRIQCKGTNWLYTKGHEDKYQFSIKKSGRKRKNVPYEKSDFDILALVGLPSQAAFFTTDFTSTKTKQVACKKFNTERERQTWERCLDECLNV